MKKGIAFSLSILTLITVLTGCVTLNDNTAPGIWIRVQNKLYVGGIARDIRLYSINGDGFSEYFNSNIETYYGEVSDWIDISGGYSSVFSPSITVDFRYWTGSSWSSIETGELGIISGSTLHDGQYYTAPLFNIL